MGLFSKSIEAPTNGHHRGPAAAVATAEPSRNGVEAPSAPVAPALAPPPQSERQAYVAQLRGKLHQRLVDKLDFQSMRSMPPHVVRQEVRALIRDGVDLSRFRKIEGVADRELLVRDNPADPRNRRISILMTR